MWKYLSILSAFSACFLATVVYKNMDRKVVQKNDQSEAQVVTKLWALHAAVVRSFSGNHTPDKLPPAIKKSPIEINTSIFLEDDLKSFHAMNVIMIREVPNNERLADTVVRTLLTGELASVSKDVLA